MLVYQRVPICGSFGNGLLLLYQYCEQFLPLANAQISVAPGYALSPVWSTMAHNTHNIGMNTGQSLNKSMCFYINILSINCYVLLNISRYLSCFMAILQSDPLPSAGSAGSAGCAWCPRILLIIGQLDIVPSQWSTWGCTWGQKWIRICTWCMCIQHHITIVTIVAGQLKIPTHEAYKSPWFAPKKKQKIAPRFAGKSFVGLGIIGMSWGMLLVLQWYIIPGCTLYIHKSDSNVNNSFYSLKI